MITVSVDMSAVREQLGTARDKLNPRVLLTLISHSLIEYVSKQFETRGEGRWAPLSALTLARRKRGGDVPLQDTGGYRMTFAGQPGAPDPLTDEQTFVEIGSADIRAGTLSNGAMMGEYGRYYQLSRLKRFGPKEFQRYAGMRKGHPIPWGNIPARPVIPTKDVADTLLQNELTAYVEALNG